jgi:hypothetical protein
MKTINPVLVGVGQYVQRKPSEDQLASTIDLAAKASQRALEDAGAAVDLSGTVDTIVWIRTFSDTISQFESRFKTAVNPPWSLAKRLGIQPQRKGKVKQRVTIEEDGRRLSIRNRSQGVCGKVFQSVGVVMPPAMQGA